MLSKCIDKLNETKQNKTLKLLILVIGPLSVQ